MAREMLGTPALHQHFCHHQTCHTTH